MTNFGKKERRRRFVFLEIRLSNLFLTENFFRPHVTDSVTR